MNTGPRELMLLAATLLIGAGVAGCGGSTTELPSAALSGAARDDSSVAGSVPHDSAVAGSVPHDSAVAGSVPHDFSTLAADSGDTRRVAAVPTDKAPGGADSSPGDRSEPLHYSVRKAVQPADASTIPPVLLSASHAKLTRVQVGDSFPPLSLPQLGGTRTDLKSLRGQQATVVLCWSADRWMARTALTDMQRDIADEFDAKQVATVGIAVRQPAGAVQAALNQSRATFPQLLDSDGRAFATLGSVALPRLYVLDPTGMIVWFDIEYSEGTRRELWQTLGVLTK